MLKCHKLQFSAAKWSSAVTETNTHWKYNDSTSCLLNKSTVLHSKDLLLHFLDLPLHGCFATLFALPIQNISYMSVSNCSVYNPILRIFNGKDMVVHWDLFYHPYLDSLLLLICNPTTCYILMFFILFIYRVSVLSPRIESTDSTIHPVDCVYALQVPLLCVHT